MCGRYAITSQGQDLSALFGCDAPENCALPRHNVAPSQSAPVVCQTAGQRRMVTMRWGLAGIGARGTAPLINARAETVADKPSFRTAFRHGRCLAPANAFYEWRKQPGAPGDPFAVARRDRRPFAMAAIRDTVSFALVTTNANEALKPLHHRMPVMLDEAHWVRWLETPATDALSLRELLMPVPDDLLEAWPVSRRVNRITQDDPGLLEQIAAPQVPHQTSLF